jgi:hypothetical protein
VAQVGLEVGASEAEAARAGQQGHAEQALQPISIMTYLQGECSYRRADSVSRCSVGRVLVLKSPLPGWRSGLPHSSLSRFSAAAPLAESRLGEVPHSPVPECDSSGPWIRALPLDAVGLGFSV